MKTRTQIFAVLALAFGALGAQGSALADGDHQQHRGSGHWRHHGGHGGHHSFHHGRGQHHSFHRGDRLDPVASMMRMHRKLDLTAQQQAAWDKTRQQSHEASRNMHATARDVQAKLREQLKQPGADLKQLARNEDQLRDQMRDAHRKMRDAWLGVYDSLDAKQKERIQQYMLARSEHAGPHHGHG
jgi:hypothetical protein